MAKLQLLYGTQAPQETSTERPSWDASSFIGQFMAGYVEGLTTFDVLDNYDIVKNNADTEAEYIARSLGSVLGFIGFLPFPGTGTFTRLGFSTAAKAMKLVGQADKAKSLAAEARAVKMTMTSIPMITGRVMSGGVMRMLESGAAKSALQFGEQAIGRSLSAGAKARISSYTETGLFMGFASAAAARPMNPMDIFSEGWDERWEAAKYGMAYGVGQQAIASFFSPKLMEKLGAKNFKELMQKEPDKAEFMLKSLRGVSTGLVMGGYAAAEGFPNELVLYETLVNGVFGYRELPWYNKQAMKLMNKHLREEKVADYLLMQKTPEKYLESVGETDLPPEVINSFSIAATAHFGNTVKTASAYIEAMKKTEAARRGVDVESLGDEFISEMIQSGDITKAKAWQSLLEYDQIMKMETDKAVNTFEEVHKRKPSEEEMHDISDAAKDNADAISVDLWYNNDDAIRIIKDVAKRVHYEQEMTQQTPDQLLKVASSMREAGISMQAAEFVTTLSDVLGKEHRGFETLRTINEIIRTNKRDGQKNYIPVRDQLTGKFGITLTKEQDNAFRHLWAMYSNSKTRKMLKVNLSDYDVFRPTEHLADGTFKAEIDNVTPIEKMTGLEAMYLKTAVDKKTDVPIHSSKVNASRLMVESFKKNWWYFSGKKDNHHMVFFDMTEAKFEPGDFNLAKEALAIDAVLKPLQDPSKGDYVPFLEQYAKDKALFVAEALRDVPEGKAIGEKIAAEKAYDALYSFNAVQWKKFNHAETLAELFADRDAFSITDVTKFNKRTQLMFDVGIPMDPSVVGREKLSARVAEWTPESLGLFKTEFGRMFGGKNPLQYDGVAWVRREAAKAFGSYSGNEEGGFHKIAAVHSDDLGGLLGKQGFHVMTAKEESMLDKSGISDDIVFFESATKLKGKRPVTKLTLSKEGITHDATEVINPEDPLGKRTGGSFEIPVESIRLNLSAAEDPTIKPAHIAKPLLNHFEESPELSRLIMEKYVLPGFEGDALPENSPAEAIAKTNTGIFRAGKDQPMTKELGVDIDKVPLKDLFEVMKDMPNDARLNTLARKLMRYQFERGDEIESDEMGEWKQIEDLISDRSNIAKKMSMMGELDPAFLAQADIHRYMEQALYKYALDRVHRPKAPNSFKAKLGYLSPIELMEYESSGKQFKPGDILLEGGLKKTPIELPAEFRGLFDGKEKTTLGEMWERLQAESNQSLQDFFDNAVAVRVPLSDLSGARAMKMAGFTKGKGFRTYVHPYDMQYMDGADLDGDSMFMYFGLERPLVDHLKKTDVKHRFTHWSDKSGRDLYDAYSVPPELVDSPLLEKRFTMDKAGNEALLAGDQAQYDFLKNPASMFSPYARNLVNRIATMGKGNLGPGLVAALRGKQLYKYANGKPIVTQIEDVGEVTLVPKGLRAQRMTQAQTVNLSADAADGHAMADVNHIRAANVLSPFRVFVDGKELSPKEYVPLFSKSKTFYIKGREVKSPYLNRLPLIKTLAEFDGALRNRDFEGNLRNLQDIMAKIRNVSTRVEDINFDNTWYNTSKLLATLDYRPHPASFMNYLSRKVVFESLDTFFKSFKRVLGAEKERAVGEFIMSLMGRRGLSFTKSKITDTNEWKILERELDVYHKNDLKSAKGYTGSKAYLDDFINSEDFRLSKLWEISKNFPSADRKSTTDRTPFLMKELAELSLYADNDLVKYNMEKVVAHYTNEGGKPGWLTFDRFNNFDQNVKDLEATMEAKGINKYEVSYLPRTEGEQVIEARSLFVKDLHDVASLKMMNEVLSKYVADSNPKDVREFLDKDLHPFLRTISTYRSQLIESQQDVFSSYGPNRAGKSKAYQAKLKEIRAYRARLSDDKRPVFDAQFLSSFQPDPIGDEATERYNALYSKEYARANAKTLAMYAGKKLPMEKLKEIVSKNTLNRWLYASKFAQTPMFAGVVSDGMLRKYYDGFSEVSKIIETPLDQLNIRTVKDDLNIDTGRMLPAYLAADPEVQIMETKQPTKTRVSKMAGPLKKLVADASEGLDKKGRLKNLQEDAEYSQITKDLTDIFLRHKDVADQIAWIFPTIVAERTGGKVHRTMDLATKRDWQDFIRMFKTADGRMKQDVGEPIAVKNSWFFKFFSRVAKENRMKSVDKDGNLNIFTLEYPAHVNTPDGKVDLNVRRIVGALEIAGIHGEALTATKNAIDGMLKATLADRFDLYEKLNKIDGLGLKMFEAVVGVIEGPLGDPQVTPKGWELYQRNGREAMQTIASMKKKYANGVLVQDAKGKTIKMSIDNIVMEMKNKVGEYLDDIYRRLEAMEDDAVLSVYYTGETYGKVKFPMLNVDALSDKAMGIEAEKGLLMTPSKKFSSIVAVNDMLKSHKIKYYVTKTQDVIFADEMSKAKNRAIEEALSKGNEDIRQEEKFFHELSEPMRHKFIDKMTLDGYVMGFPFTADLQPLKQMWFPHMHLSEKEVTAQLQERVAKLVPKLPESQVKELSLETIRILLGYKDQLYSQNEGQNIFNRINGRADVLTTLRYENKHLKGRDHSFFGPLDGWDRSPLALHSAYEKIAKENADMFFAVVAKNILRRQTEKQVYGDNTLHIARFTERYFRQALGYADTIPQEWLAPGEDAYKYGMKNNMWKFHSDQYWMNKIQEVGNTYFGGKITGDFKSIDNIANALEFDDPKTKQAWINEGKRVLAERKLSWFSQMEAKYSLLSLLTSTKTFTTNVASAGIMTLINTSTDDFRRAFSLKAMQDEAGSHNIKSSGDIDKMVAAGGGLEGMFQQEINMHGALGYVGKETVGRLLTEIKRKGVDADVKGILVKQGVFSRLVDAGAYMMKKSEMIARKHSYLAHYMNARRSFRMQGFELEYDDPWITKIARDGVAASQYLYSNANRPAFMGSLIGKVFHRFQLFAYNSVEFRLNAMERARQIGVLPGSDDYRKFERMMAADMFMFGMASVLPFSIFNTMLPPPYNYLTDYTQFFFGGSIEDRQNAFYTGLPYPLNITQPLTPASARIFVSLLGYAYDKDAEKLTKGVVSLAPGHRLIRDVYRSYDQISKGRNPAIIIDNMTGIPLVNSGSVIKKLNKEGGIDLYLKRYEHGPYLEDMKKNEEEIDEFLRQYSSP